MIANEFGIIQRKLHASFGILSDADDQRVWYDSLRQYDFEDVDASVSAYIYANNRRPTIADIVNGARVNKSKRSRPPEFRGRATVSCPFCKDKGLIITVTPMGIVNGRPCDKCGMGRAKHPWEFKSEEEKEQALKEEEQRGLHPPRDVFEASKEQYMLYNYGVEKII